MAAPPVRITLVTTCRDAAAHVAEAIESASGQRYPNLEHVVADAASSDATLSVLARYPHLVVDSRPDRGIYDGLNRGLAMATGDVVGFLNADDRLEPGALAVVAARFAAEPGLDMLTGAARVIGEDGASRLVHVPQGGPSLAGLLFGVPVLNARFFARRFIDRVGPFGLGLPAAADRAWLVRVVVAAPRYAVTRQALYSYRAHAGSATLAGSRTVGPRLWREHVALADLLLADPEVSAELRQHARCWRALELAKLALADDRPDGPRLSQLWSLVRREPDFLRHLAAGMLAWRRRRGRHADSGA